MPAQPMPDLTRKPPCRVLVVDDNEPSAMTLTWAIELYGYEVRTCFDGKAAIEVADQFKPEVVLLDIGMPVMDGFEVCRQLRSNPDLSGLRVVAQTGWGDAETRRKTQAAGFDDHMTKPINLDELLKLLRVDDLPSA
ncbi:response regulator [Asticcacaulis taihuensis]|jgi:CheY-like chemotaxis protein|uniref:response regulator n=1 Tax=Asticcacaulis taihuensis TaxID=260084 RepID=UPI0026F2D4B7|nr:response regulator [Asticcacaulis taihuensis]